MANSTVYKYPLDLTGESPENRVVGERHIIGTSRGRIFIANHGPFYGNNLIVRDSVSGRILEPIRDYKLIHNVREAQEITGKPVYCGVRVADPDAGTEIEIDVSYVGGEFSYSTKALLDMLDAIINDNRPIDWGELIGIPNEWVPTPHMHSAYDLYAMKHVVAATNDVAGAIREDDSHGHAMLFDMITARIQNLEEVIDVMIEAFDEGTSLISSLE